MLGEEEGICPTCGATFGHKTIAMPAFKMPDMPSTLQDPEGVVTPPSEVNSHTVFSGAGATAKTGKSQKSLWILTAVIVLIAAVLLLATIFLLP